MPSFALDNLSPRSKRRFREPPLFGWRCRGTDEIDHPLQCVLTVSFLGPEPLGGQNDHAIAGHPASSEGGEALKHGLRQSRAVGGIEAQLNSARDLVHVLPTGAGCANEVLGDLVLGKADGVGNAYHGSQTAGSVGRGRNRYIVMP